MNETLPKDAIARTQPLVVELIGPAGAGKTTLLRALTQGNQIFVKGPDLVVRRIENIPFFVGNALLLLLTFLRQHGNGRWFTWYEVKAMVYLKGWHRVLRRQASKEGRIVILDPGPVFKLARLRGFGPENMNSQGFEKWWAGMLKQWAATLDMVLWLDAPDAILVERVHGRNHWHRVKEKSEHEACQFLARYRASYEQVVAKLTANGGPTVLRFDTGQESTSQIVDRMLVTFYREQGEG